MSELLATIYARRSDESAVTANRHLRTFLELARISTIERIRDLRLLWLALLATLAILRMIGARRVAARLVEKGQRSCPHAGFRRRFGKAGVALIDQLNVVPRIQGASREMFATSRVSVLKPCLGPREPGVLHLKFSEVLTAVPSLVDVKTLTRHYRLVLEPSWTGLCDPGPLQYTRLAARTVIMAPDEVDFDFIASLGGPLVPINLGPCDWVDPRIAEPFLDSPKEYDIVVNSNWAAWKRHHVLFRALRELPRSTRVALIGGTHDGGTLERIFRLARYYDVHRQLTAFQFIPFQEVMRVVSASRCSVLLSLKEGANRSLAEAMFCNVPVLLLEEHVGGIRKNVVPQTGVRVPEAQLATGLRGLLEKAESLSARSWALENISCIRSSQLLNEKLRAVAALANEEWTQDIAVRANSPESTYYDPSDGQRLASHNSAVHAFLRGKSPTPVAL
jgi:glycosyltransferase involved in cell wall biosynthesis